MKKLTYKTDKWEKRKAILIENSRYDYDEVSSLKKDYLNENIDEIRYYYTLSLCFKNIAEDEYVQGNSSGCYENIENSLNAFVTAVKLLNEGKSTNQATKLNVENKISSGYFGYYALITSNYDIIPQIVKEDSYILQMLSNKVVNGDTNNLINAMESAISLRDSVGFENALANRMKEIRKFSLDNYVCADFISVALVKEAKKAGLQFQAEYIEVDGL